MFFWVVAFAGQSSCTRIKPNIVSVASYILRCRIRERKRVSFFAYWFITLILGYDIITYDGV